MAEKQQSWQSKYISCYHRLLLGGSIYKARHVILLRQETDKEEECNSLKASAISFDKIYQSNNIPPWREGGGVGSLKTRGTGP